MRFSFTSLRDELVNRFWKQSSTFRRLLTSRHVLDLQLIFIVTLLATIEVLAWHVYSVAQMAPSERSKGLFGGEDTQFIGAVLLASGWIMAWVYQTGSKRLGVVDLFACEIVTLCRVGTIMDVVPRLITAHQNLTTSARGEAHNASGQDINFGRFISQENYFPVFDGNSRDLQILEADVVINVTAFYTYMKVLRDHFRRLGELSPGQDTNTQKGTLLVNAIYMAFLAYESARTSIEELIEFEPTQAEALVTGLVTELSAYRYLTKCFGPEDIRGRRLALREKKYEELVPKLYESVMKATGVEWENAQSTGIDLERLYNSLEFKPKINAVTPSSAAASQSRL
jgi:hypothetical protein